MSGRPFLFARPRWYIGPVRTLLICLALLGAACGRETPEAPSSEESEQLDDAENMLNDLAKEEGPGTEAPDP
jgi:hypothetical protein